MKIKYFLVLALSLLALECSGFDKTAIPDDYQNIVKVEGTNGTYRDVTVQQVCNIIERDKEAILLDVRTKEEFNGNLGHLKNGILIPVDSLNRQLDKIKDYKNITVIVYCRSGGRSKRASAALVKNGFRNVHNMLGGMRRWNSIPSDSLSCKNKLLEKSK